MLRLGLVIEAGSVPAWVLEVIRLLKRNPNIEFAVALLIDSEKHKAELTSESFALPENVPLIKSEVWKEAGMITFEKNLTNSIPGYRPDLLLYFCSKIPSAALYNLTRCGTWSICFGESHELITTSSVFWDWYRNKRHAVISLIQFTGQPPACNVIQQSRVSFNRFSFSENLAAVRTSAVKLMCERIEKLAEANTSQYNSLASLGKSILLDTNPVAPTYLNHLSGFLTWFVRTIKKTIKENLFITDWVVFYELSGTQTPTLDFRKFKPLIPPKDRFWADPFVVSKDDKHYIFLEEFLWKTKKGHLSCMVLDAKGKQIESKIILDKPYHLSYPFIYKHNDHFYLIPESSENKTIDIYECVDFPFEWKWKETLISDIDAVDTTIHYYKDRHWLFCGVKSNPEINVYDNLNIYYSNSLLGGNWTPHPKNPVVSDIKSARPAGRVFDRDGTFLRPSQIGVPFYGYGLSLNRIIELNEDNYKEEEYLLIKPDWNKKLHSIHTLNSSERMTVTDGVLTRFRS